MATALPQNFPIPQETAIASYDSTSIADGTGISIFYGYNTKEGGTESHHLGTTQVYSHDVDTGSATVQATSFTKYWDLDFDVEFNLSRIVRGNSKVSVPNMTLEAAGGGQCESYIHARVRKWDGTTETELADASGAVFAVASGVYDTHIDVLNINIPRTPFKKGETLRLTVEHWAKKTTSDGGVTTGHDPKDRDPSESNYTASADTTALEFHVPFELDL